MNIKKQAAAIARDLIKAGKRKEAWALIETVKQASTEKLAPGRRRMTHEQEMQQAVQFILGGLDKAFAAADVEFAPEVQAAAKNAVAQILLGEHQAKTASPASVMLQGLGEIVKGLGGNPEALEQVSEDQKKNLVRVIYPLLKPFLQKAAGIKTSGFKENLGGPGANKVFIKGPPRGPGYGEGTEMIELNTDVLTDILVEVLGDTLTKLGFDEVVGGGPSIGHPIYDAINRLVSHLEGLVLESHLNEAANKSFRP